MVNCEVRKFDLTWELSFEANFGAMTSHFEATFDAILTILEP